MFFLNIVAASLLLVSVLASYVSPAVAWIIALFGIAYPYILVLNILFLLYWLIIRDKAFLLSLAIILLGYSNLKNQLQLDLHAKPKLDPEKAFKVLSFNTRLFDLYEWSKKTDTKKRIFELIQAEDPEILCIQEFYTSSTRPGFDNLETLKNIRKKPFVHMAYTDTKRGSDFWGIATFSNFPIVRKGNILFNETTNNLCIYTDIKINDDTIRIYNAHFQSNRLQREDYEFLGNPKNKKEKWLASRNILYRIKTGSIKRSKQVDVVAAHIENSPYPVILCGDFNDPPSSYTYNRLRNNLKDAFEESGRGFGNTYNGLIPLLRIDYILHDKKLKSADFKVMEEDLSDHYPLSCRLQLTGK
ncbi:endonuclease/exonuclease/phosphatase family protein [Adhaeribacter terreus]|uniref:Endonuclease/exonuclease/phosphatase family protein n=1 Tax=Adhaeribacter terreus TaxID=529703 RepID=A0ABW0EE17_9BACT